MSAVIAEAIEEGPHRQRRNPQVVATPKRNAEDEAEFAGPGRRPPPGGRRPGRARRPRRPRSTAAWMSEAASTRQHAHRRAATVTGATVRDREAEATEPTPRPRHPRDRDRS
jgi:hypothetical protein